MNFGLLIIYLLSAVGLGICLEKHGQTETKKRNIFLDLIGTIVWLVLIWWALGWRFI